MAAGADLVELTAALPRARLLCIGDVMLDRYVYGEVSRISPEAPIPILRATDKQEVLGGAGNVVRNAAALGASTCFVAVVGGDEEGETVARLLAAQPRLTQSLIRDGGRRTTIKTRFVAAGGQQMLRVDEEGAAVLPPETLRAVVEAATKALEDCDVVVLSDYGKGVLAPAAVAEIVEAARRAGRPVFVDPKADDYACYRGASVVTPNLKELRDATRMPADDDRGITAAARLLIERCGIGSVLVTRSRDGMTLVDAGAPPIHLPAAAREVFDVSGAGDTVVATLALAHAVGASPRAAAALANIAAGIVVGKVGTAVAHPREIAEALLHRQLAGAGSKVQPLDTAVERVALWRRAGCRIGFTNGCFDLLHPGHIHLLSQAAGACDRLVVGLNSDDSVRRLKGAGRPVQHAVARGTVLASLGSVDLVVIFEDDTPERLIRAIRPDVLVKGADYAMNEVVGADFVAGYGGRVMLADLAHGFSTTGTIARLTGVGRPDTEQS